mmetsp:Transcript_11227/g.21383  ORF Transcript_11227/g.21383 Transcript_11227/m.21383 type:complete len:254 (+) Transcript_11227:560-1321(+)
MSAVGGTITISFLTLVTRTTCSQRSKHDRLRFSPTFWLINVMLDTLHGLALRDNKTRETQDTAAASSAAAALLAFISSTFLRSSRPRWTAWIFTAAASCSLCSLIASTSFRASRPRCTAWIFTAAASSSGDLSISRTSSPTSLAGLDPSTALALAAFISCTSLRASRPLCTAWIFTAAAVCSLSSPTSLRACRPRIAAWIFTAASSSSAVSAITALMSWYDSRYVTCCRVSRSLCSLCAASAWKPFTELTACV